MKNHLLALLMLIGLFTIACNLGVSMQSSLITPTSGETSNPRPTTAQTPEVLPTTDPQTAARACLLGTWEFMDLGRYVMAAIPSELVTEYSLRYSGSNGVANFKLSPNGEFNLSAEQLQLLFKAKVAIFPVTLTVSINGDASGKYTVDGNQLIITEVDTSGLSASAKAAGQDVLDPSQLIAAIPLINPPNNTAEYNCSDELLSLEIPDAPISLPALTFQRGQD